MANTQAVVVGASMTGLSMAAALADDFERVTVVERDPLPGDAVSRKGVPQDRHLHLLLPGGAEALEQLLPGVLDEMVAEGATRGDAHRIRMSLNGHRLAPAPIGHRAVFASRPLVEAHVRRRVTRLPTVHVRERQVASELVTDGEGRRVVGVGLAGDGSESEVLPADLVVDCAGRGSRTAAWLEALGFEPPEVDRLEVDVRYVTRTIALPSDVLDGDLHVLVGPTSEEPRGGAMTHVGPDRWLVTLFAVAGAAAPTENIDEFQAFAAQLPIPDIHDAVAAGEAVGAASEYRFRANQRRRYEQVPTLPDGLLVAGDAVCSFNPIYGQGMSVAALEAVVLRGVIASGQRPSPRRWFREITPIVDSAWELAVGADLAIDQIEGPRPVRTRFATAYSRWLHAAAETDPDLTRRFARVAGMIDPPTRLLHPAAMIGVLKGGARRWLARRRGRTS